MSASIYYGALKRAEELMLNELDDLDAMILGEACEDCQKRIAQERDLLFQDIGDIQQLLMEADDES